MLELGRIQEAVIVKMTDHGAYVAQPNMPAGLKNSDNELERVLLPRKYVSKEAAIGDVLTVFIYRDSKDRPVATTLQPKVTLGQLGVLAVVESSVIGAFLDWGLEKDLLLPFKEQTYPVKKGEEILIALYIDKSGRLCATMKVYDYLSADSPYQKEDQVQGRIYQINSELGAFVAVDDQYYGMIPRQELYEKLKLQQVVSLRVLKVRSDGKLDVSIRRKAYKQMDEDAQMVASYIKGQGGRIFFDDKADPELIRKTFGLSKNAFKRAVGHLLKEGKIEIEKGAISLKDHSYADRE